MCYQHFGLCIAFINWIYRYLFTTCVLKQAAIMWGDISSIRGGRGCCPRLGIWAHRTTTTTSYLHAALMLTTSVLGNTVVLQLSPPTYSSYGDSHCVSSKCEVLSWLYGAAGSSNPPPRCWTPWGAQHRRRPPSDPASARPPCYLAASQG